MLYAIFSNLPEIILGLAWTGLIFWWGRLSTRWWKLKQKVK